MIKLPKSKWCKGVALVLNLVVNVDRLWNWFVDPSTGLHLILSHWQS
jgi:hypothetical protein